MRDLSILDHSYFSAPKRVQPWPFINTAPQDLPKRVDKLPWQANVYQAPLLVSKLLQDRSIAEQIFEALAEAKIWTSKVAMHLDLEARNRLFRQLDVLHDAEDWDDRDKAVNVESYKSLVRAIIHHEINSRPSLAIMPNGNVLAQWERVSDKLTIEFLPENRTYWLVQCVTQDGPERASGSSPLERLRTVLAPYQSERWFDAS